VNREVEGPSFNRRLDKDYRKLTGLLLKMRRATWRERWMSPMIDAERKDEEEEKEPRTRQG
jgi:hypothetical protein